MVVALRRWLRRTSADLPTQFAWVQPAPLLRGGDRGWAAVVSGQRALRNAVQRMAEEFERIELRVQRLRTSQRQGSRIE